MKILCLICAFLLLFTGCVKTNNFDDKDKSYLTISDSDVTAKNDWEIIVNTQKNNTYNSTNLNVSSILFNGTEYICVPFISLINNLGYSVVWENDSCGIISIEKSIFSKNEFLFDMNKNELISKNKGFNPFEIMSGECFYRFTNNEIYTTPEIAGVALENMGINVVWKINEKEKKIVYNQSKD